MAIDRWWDDDPRERYWMEITSRPDVGADLKAPQETTGNQPKWHYELVSEVSPGDIVFHYKNQTVIGASVAGGPVETRPIIWTPHTTTGAGSEDTTPRPGWWIPVYQFTKAASPLTRDLINADHQFIESWLDKITTSTTRSTSTGTTPTSSHQPSVRPRLT